MTAPTAQDPAATGLYLDPWTPDHEPAAVDRLILATARADELAAHLAERLEHLATTLDDGADGRGGTAATGAELHALGLCAVHIRQLLADVTRLAGAYV